MHQINIHISNMALCRLKCHPRNERNWKTLLKLFPQAQNNPEMPVRRVELIPLHFPQANASEEQAHAAKRDRLPQKQSFVLNDESCRPKALLGTKSFVLMLNLGLQWRVLDSSSPPPATIGVHTAYAFQIHKIIQDTMYILYSILYLISKYTGKLYRNTQR